MDDPGIFLKPEADRENYVIAIPSFRRASICHTHTLKLLQDHSIPLSRIWVFVADEPDLLEYTHVLPPAVQLVLGVPGVVPQREFIQAFFPEGCKIVSIDDDVKAFDSSLSKLPWATTLDSFLENSFLECEKVGAQIWGVYPCWNVRFRTGREEISTCLNYICAAFYGFFNTFPINRLELTREGNKEDVERSLKYFLRDGAVVRFNTIGFYTKYYNAVGGLGTFKQRLVPMREACDRLQAVYGDLGRTYTRKNGMTEFRLKKLKSFVPAASDRNAPVSPVPNAVSRHM